MSRLGAVRRPFAGGRRMNGRRGGASNRPGAQRRSYTRRESRVAHDVELLLTVYLERAMLEEKSRQQPELSYRSCRHPRERQPSIHSLRTRHVQSAADDS